MNTRTLEQYVQTKNDWRKLFNKPPLSLDNAADRQKIAQELDSSLSPENLTCDGELPRAQVEKKYRILTKCAAELKALDPSVTMWEV